MKKFFLVFFLVAVFALAVPAQVPQVLIVADEFPAMQVLAAKLRAGEGLESRLVKQEDLAAVIAMYPAVIVYIHGALRPGPEKSLVDYVNDGGKLIVLHHSISSGKRTNQTWFPALGVSLPTTPFEEGGYKYFDPVTMDIVNLAPTDVITSRKTKWESRTTYASNGPGSTESAAKERPALTLTGTEVYLNHVFTGPRTILLGVKWTDPKTGKTYMQDTAGWYRPSGNGWIFYFMPGHSTSEFENPIYSQMVLNAVVWKPAASKR